MRYGLYQVTNRMFCSLSISFKPENVLRVFAQSQKFIHQSAMRLILRKSVRRFFRKTFIKTYKTGDYFAYQGSLGFGSFDQDEMHV